jgi:hypothetical protein
MSKLKADLDAAMERNNADLKKRLSDLAAGGQAEPEPEPEADGYEGQRSGPRITSVSFTREEYEFVKQVFEHKGRGMKTATGIKIAALYVAERLDAGYITMSRAGILERR